MNNPLPPDVMAVLLDRRDARRALIRQIIHECPKLSGEPSADCVGALSGVAVGEAKAALEAAQVDAMRSRIERLEEALRQCAKIVERNLYHQHEKIEDVPKIARAALGDDG